MVTTNRQYTLPAPVGGHGSQRIVRVGEDALLVTLDVANIDEADAWSGQGLAGKGHQMWLCSIEGDPVVCLARWGKQAAAPSQAEVEAMLAFARKQYPTWFTLPPS